MVSCSASTFAHYKWKFQSYFSAQSVALKKKHNTEKLLNKLQDFFLLNTIIRTNVSICREFFFCYYLFHLDLWTTERAQGNDFIISPALCGDNNMRCATTKFTEKLKAVHMTNLLMCICWITTITPSNQSFSTLTHSMVGVLLFVVDLKNHSSVSNASQFIILELPGTKM